MKNIFTFFLNPRHERKLGFQHIIRLVNIFYWREFRGWPRPAVEGQKLTILAFSVKKSKFFKKLLDSCASEREIQKET